MIHIGIDPGLSGAIAFLYPEGNRLSLYAMPVQKAGKRNQIDEKALYDLLSPLAAATGVMATVELVGAMPGQGVTSMFSFGCSWGLVRGMLSGLRIPYQLVRPQAWQKVMLAGQPGCEYQVASRLWPTVDFRATPRCKKPHDGLLDAALIAEFGRRTQKGE